MTIIQRALVIIITLNIASSFAAPLEYSPAFGIFNPRPATEDSSQFVSAPNARPGASGLSTLEGSPNRLPNDRRYHVPSGSFLPELDTEGSSQFVSASRSASGLSTPKDSPKPFALNDQGYHAQFGTFLPEHDTEFVPGSRSPSGLQGSPNPLTPNDFVSASRSASGLQGSPNPLTPNDASTSFPRKLTKPQLQQTDPTPQRSKLRKRPPTGWIAQKYTPPEKFAPPPKPGFFAAGWARLTGSWKRLKGQWVKFKAWWKNFKIKAKLLYVPAVTLCASMVTMCHGVLP